MYIDWRGNGMKRIYTSIGIVAALAAAFALRLLTVWIFDVLVLALAVVAVWEIMKARKSDSKGVTPYYIYPYMFIAYMAFLLGVLQSFAWWLHIVLQVVAIAIFAFYIYIMNYTDKDFIKEATLKKQKTSRAAWGTALEFLKLVAYPFALLFSLIILNHTGDWAQITLTDGADPVSVGMMGTFGLLLVFGISCFTDTFAYIVGKVMKGKKLCPKISPGKTISGGIGGLFGGVVGSLVVVLLCSIDSTLSAFLSEKISPDTVIVQLVFIVVGLIGSVINQAGDIYASHLKRRAEIKDFGKWLPGHGGAMDRLDGISFNALFIAIVFIIITFI